MATKRAAVHDNLELHFIALPFKLAYVYGLLTLTVFLIATAMLCYFTTPQELQTILDRYLRTRMDGADWHQAIGAKIYTFLNWLLLELTQIRAVMGATYQPQTAYFNLQKFLFSHAEGLNQFVLALKVMSYRIGVLCTYTLFLAPLLFVVAMFDGAGQRAIRRDNIGRESAGIYHRVKYWNRASTILFIQFFVAAPFFINPQFFVVPVLVWACFVTTTFKYYKKYL